MINDKQKMKKDLYINPKKLNMLGRKYIENIKIINPINTQEIKIIYPLNSQNIKIKNL